MTKDYSIQDQLREQLKKLFPDYKESGNKKEFRINCPLCAKKGNPDHDYHMYISLGYDDKPPMYNCFKDYTHRGILTKSFLEQNTQYPQYIDTVMLSQVAKRNSVLSDLGRYRQIRTGKYEFGIPLSFSERKNDIKLKWFNNRLGCNLSFNDLVRMKVILNLKDFLKYNNISNFTRTPYVVDLLDQYFIGFLTNTNSNIIFRNLVKERNKLPEIVQDRYIKYSIVEGGDSGYYTIPSTVDIYKPVNIHIAEGPFDILSVFIHLNGMNNQQNIYSSIGGNSYLNAMQYYIVGCGIVNPIFHIYIDNDIPSKFLDDIKRVIKPLNLQVFIHMNIAPNEKDFGVSLDRIKHYSYEL
jgi:hypothetical protein